MSSQTPNINLTLPAGSENVSRQIINDNNTKIDTAIGSLSDSLTLEIYALIDITNPTISFNANGVGFVPLRAGYWLLTASVSNGEALGVSYSYHNQYILKNTNYANTNFSVYLTWVKIPAP